MEYAVAGMALLALLAAGCAAGDHRFQAAPAGFWAGLWHGFICLLAFIVSFFSSQVGIYEAHNTGAWYNFGFILGAACFFGGSWGSQWKRREKGRREKEWDEIGVKVEEKVRRGLKSWLDECDKGDRDWDEIARKVEDKIKCELRSWAEK
jgi:hypothetical protein